jgi:hypothetical protein
MRSPPVAGEGETCGWAAAQRRRRGVKGDAEDSKAAGKGAGDGEDTVHGLRADPILYRLGAGRKRCDTGSTAFRT